MNILAHKCLMLAYGEDTHRVTRAHVRLATRDTPGVVARLPWWRRVLTLVLPPWGQGQGESP